MAVQFKSQGKGGLCWWWWSWWQPANDYDDGDDGNCSAVKLPQACLARPQSGGGGRLLPGKGQPAMVMTMMVMIMMRIITVRRGSLPSKFDGQIKPQKNLAWFWFFCSTVSSLNNWNHPILAIVPPSNYHCLPILTQYTASSPFNRWFFSSKYASKTPCILNCLSKMSQLATYSLWVAKKLYLLLMLLANDGKLGGEIPLSVVFH